MPSPSDFRRAFGLERGPLVVPSGDDEDDTSKRKKRSSAGDMRIEDHHVGHDVVTTFERYVFPIVLDITVHGAKSSSRRVDDDEARSREQVLQRLQNSHSGKHIVYSNYGSPYECTLPSDKWQVTSADDDASSSGSSRSIHSFRCTNRGVAVRRRDIPSLKSSKESDEETLKAVAHLKELGGYRIIKSHFASGKCVSCAQQILPGAQIAQLESTSGWGHVVCLSKAVMGPLHRGMARSSHPEDNEMSSHHRRVRRRTSTASKHYNLRSRRSSTSDSISRNKKNKK